MAGRKQPIEQVFEEGAPVKLPSGAVFQVLTSSEVAYVEDRVKQYTAEFRWQNVSDIQDVDRIIILELLVYRYGLFISKQKDYFGDAVDENALRRIVGDFSGELRLIKKSLGMDKQAREKESGADSLPAYLDQLRIRAKAFGINRDNMTAKAIELGQQVIALWTLWHNCDEQERMEQRCTAEDIMNWIGDTYKPEFESVDKHFRETNQKMWISSQ